MARRPMDVEKVGVDWMMIGRIVEVVRVLDFMIMIFPPGIWRGAKLLINCFIRSHVKRVVEMLEQSDHDLL